MRDDAFGRGFACQRSGGTSADFLPAPGEDLGDWVRGFCAGLARDLFEPPDPTLQAALLRHGIDGDLLEAVLRAAEAVARGGGFGPWPMIPLRGWGRAPTGGRRS